jgi:hypothetical protein
VTDPELAGDAGRAALLGALVGLPVGSPFALPLFVGRIAPLVTAVAALFGALLVALLTALQFGGIANLRRQIVLWLLHRDGLVARDVPDFLAYAVRLNLLRRQGGGYEFVHPLLRQYFAELDVP